MKNAIGPAGPTVADDLKSSVTQLTFVGSNKGGVGKSLLAALSVDLLEMGGHKARIVQIDEQDRLPALYPGRVQTVSLATLEDARSDPAAVVASFDGFYAEIEKTMADTTPMVADIGGPYQIATEEYFGMVDLDEDFVESGITVRWLIPTTAEPEAMRAAVRTAKQVGCVLPSAIRTIVLNGRDGPFRFYPGSLADVLWRDELEPLCKKLGVLKLPAISAGSWAPFEMAGKRFVDVVAADIPDIQAWSGRSRPASKVIRGDVAAFMAAADIALGPLLRGDRGEMVSNAG